MSRWSSKHTVVAVLALLLPCADSESGPVRAVEFRCPNQASSEFSNRYLAVRLGWSDGVLTLRPGQGLKYENGARGIKVAWNRLVPGTLAVTGRRLDADAAPLRADVLDGYGDIGGVTSILIFPTSGCWEVTGTLDNHSLTFVLRVEIIDVDSDRNRSAPTF
jgi:hypothetical protein